MPAWSLRAPRGPETSIASIRAVWRRCATTSIAFGNEHWPLSKKRSKRRRTFNEQRKQRDRRPGAAGAGLPCLHRKLRSLVAARPSHRQGGDEGGHHGGAAERTVV